MSYQVLARKYRPRDFASLVGQDHVVRALTNALSQNRLHHAYLFTGTRGVGKTTLARILAKSLNCVGADGKGGITENPCGVCNPCNAIDSGNFVDYIEMDAASNRGVDDMTQLLERAMYAPAQARTKVYMIDEVHMLTSHAFNAMLKTLEEPPPYVKFILATTDAHKIPVTVLSRCLQFSLKQMPIKVIAEHLGKVLATENISAEPSALNLLAKGAHGSMRDALSLTDQAIVYSNNNITLSAMREMIGMADSGYLLAIAQALKNDDARALFAIADQLTGQSLSLARMLDDLADLWRQLALLQVSPEALDPTTPDLPTMQELAQSFSPEQLQVYYQITTYGNRDLGLAPDETGGFVMTLLRLLRFVPRTTPPNTAIPLRASGTVEVAAVPTPVPETPVASAPPAPAPVAEASVASAPPAPAPVAEASVADPAPEAAPVAKVKAASGADKPARAARKTSTPASKPPSGALTPTASVEPAAPVAEGLQPLEAITAANWAQVVTTLRLQGLALQFALDCEYHSSQDLTLTLKISNRQALGHGSEDKLQAALTKRYAINQLQFVFGDTSQTPRQQKTASTSAAIRALQQEVESAPQFQSFKTELGATLLTESLSLRKGVA